MHLLFPIERKNLFWSLKKSTVPMKFAASCKLSARHKGSGCPWYPGLYQLLVTDTTGVKEERTKGGNQYHHRRLALICTARRFYIRSLPDHEMTKPAGVLGKREKTKMEARGKNISLVVVGDLDGALRALEQQGGGGGKS